jgi:hypothetical protein
MVQKVLRSRIILKRLWLRALFLTAYIEDYSKIYSFPCGSGSNKRSDAVPALAPGTLEIYGINYERGRKRRRKKSVRLIFTQSIQCRNIQYHAGMRTWQPT